MPIYEFVCEKCSKTYSKLFRINENVTSIPCECGERAYKIISTTSFKLKGKGWYKDGYSKEKE